MKIHTFLDYKTNVRHITRGLFNRWAHGEFPYMGGTYGLAVCGINSINVLAKDNSHDDATCEKCLAVVATTSPPPALA